MWSINYGAITFRKYATFTIQELRYNYIRKLCQIYVTQLCNKTVQMGTKNYIWKLRQNCDAEITSGLRQLPKQTYLRKLRNKTNANGSKKILNYYIITYVIKRHYNVVLPLEAYLPRKALFKSIMTCHRYMSEVSDNFQSAPLGGLTGNCFRDEFNSKISI